MILVRQQDRIHAGHFLFQFLFQFLHPGTQLLDHFQATPYFLVEQLHDPPGAFHRLVVLELHVLRDHGIDDSRCVLGIRRLVANIEQCRPILRLDFQLFRKLPNRRLHRSNLGQ